MAAEQLGALAFAGAEPTFAAWLGGDQVGDAGSSEAMVVLIFSVGNTVYTAQ